MKINVGDKVKVVIRLAANGESFDYWEFGEVVAIDEYNYYIETESGIKKPVGKSSTEGVLEKI